MVKIAFWDNGLGERGTTVSLYNYAHYNESILGNESIIMYNKNHYSNKPYTIKKFTDRFQVFGVNNWSDVDNTLQETGCDILYITKAGGIDGQVSNVCKTVVHAVFTLTYPHGDVYAGISDFLNVDSKTNFPIVPYIVPPIPDVKTNFREDLNIPQNALVFGTYSGAECFNIDYIKNVVKDIATNPMYSNIYFIFMNIHQFTDTDRVKFLPGTSDLNTKQKFVNTCDAMLYGRDGGETFGMAVAEFCMSGKPIICRDNEHSRYHLDVLGDSAILHNNYNELYTILTNWNTTYSNKICPEKYQRFSPENVMQIFKNVFIDSIRIKKTTINPTQHISWLKTLKI